MADRRNDRTRTGVNAGLEERSKRSGLSKLDIQNHESQGAPFQGDSTTQYAQSPTIKRKEVPANTDISTTPQQDGNTHRQVHPHENPLSSASDIQETSLPIASEFASQRPGSDTKSSLATARKILNREDSAAQASLRTQDTADNDGLTKEVERLNLNGPEATSPASFSSAQENHATTQSEAEHNLSAEEIIQHAKHSSIDTTYHNKIAPAVTHETIERRVHEITQEQITRDIHHYHHVHRIQPVHEVEVLPAKHYRIVNGVQVEMKPEEVPQSRIDAWESSIVPKG